MKLTRSVFVILTILVSVLDCSEISKSHELSYSGKRSRKKILAYAPLALTVGVEMGIVLCVIAGRYKYLEIPDSITIPAFGLYGINKYCMFKAEVFKSKFVQLSSK